MLARFADALRAAAELGPTLRAQIPVKAQLSMALHWGSSRLTENQDRIGGNVYATFALEKLRHAVPALDQELAIGRTA